MTNPLIDLIRMADIATPHAIRVAATLRLPQLIAEGSTRLNELASRAHAHPDTLGRVLRLLVLRKVFTEPEPGTFGLTEIGQLLLDDDPFHLRAGFDLDGFGRADLAFSALLKSVRTGEPAYPDVYGKPLWEDLAAHHELSASFDALMERNRMNTNPAVLSGYAWESVDHIVDVGGGRGSLLETLLTAYPRMHGTLVELPATAAFAKRRMADAGLSGRCTVIAGSFFDPLPAGASVYLLSFVLHDWNDQDAIRILDQCAVAAGTDGQILVIERTSIDERQSEDFICMDLRMLVHCGGRERTLEEFHDLVAKAGLIIRRARHGLSYFSLLECVNDGKS